MGTGPHHDGIGGAVASEPLASTGRQGQQEGREYPSRIAITLLTGGQDPHYALGLGTALMAQNVALDVIGGAEITAPEFLENASANFYNLHQTQDRANLAKKLELICIFYARLFRYVLDARPRIFHVLWNNKLALFDRTLLMMFYKLAGKKIVFTAHNVNAGRRDGKDTWLNRITLRCQYALTDRIFVHTSKMMDELIGDFNVKAEKVTIIPYGVNNAVPFTELTSTEARQRLGLLRHEKVILYYGAIKSYKGLEYLVEAFQQIIERGDYRLLIAGEKKKGYEEYWRSIQQAIDSHPSHPKILQRIEFIPDAETETYFKAADIAVLPYTDIFQSGILFMAYNYGLPAIVTDVGSFAEDVVEGETGYVCKPRDPADLARTIERFFDSELYRELASRRQGIRDYVLSKHSWHTVASITRNAYGELLERAS
jgi:D-inositol-3-phosphate glycosyltransferase